MGPGPLEPFVRIVRLAVLSAFAMGACCASPALARGPSYALLHALSAVQNLGRGDMLALQTWAQGGAVAPAKPFFTYERVEAQIAALARPDRDAVVAWLNGGGRGKLYARNATDADIGPCKFPIDSASCASSQRNASVRTLHFALPSGEPANSGDIAIEHGFAVATKDGLTEVHCLSFKNVATKTATEVDFAYQLLSKENDVLDSGINTRKGTFSPNVQIAGPADYGGFTGSQSGVGNRGFRDNCWSTTTKVARMAALQAHYFTVRVRKVTYADGSSWPQP